MSGGDSRGGERADRRGHGDDPAGRHGEEGSYARPMFEREESDQLPEEGPGQQVPEDDDEASRGDAEKQAGGADEGQSDDAGKQTGNPPNAG